MVYKLCSFRLLIAVILRSIVWVSLLFYLVSCSVEAATLNEKTLKRIIDVGKIPVDLTSYDERSQEIFSHYNGDTILVAKYLKPDGTGDGSSYRIPGSGDPVSPLNHRLHSNSRGEAVSPFY